LYSKIKEIVNTFGVPRYKEVNPAIYCMSMLPFKFGVMFGDIGHGMLLFLAGIFLCRKHATLKPNTQIYNHIIFKARYIVVLLGFFALYSGFIYNNLFSLPVGLFAGSCYKTIEVNYNCKNKMKIWQLFE
jgi:V-type H+-transporting ATPase subunit a